MIRLGFLGAGNMATAMIGGITKAELPVSICAYDPNMPSLPSGLPKTFVKTLTSG